MTKVCSLCGESKPLSDFHSRVRVSPILPSEVTAQKGSASPSGEIGD